MHSKNTKRFEEIDIWRGLAIVGMIIFHIAYIANYMDLGVIRYYEGGWRVLARMVQWSFLLVVGISLQISYQNTLKKGKTKSDFLFKTLERALLIFVCAAIVSFGTYLVAPDRFIRFGILHHIGTTLLILSPLVNWPKLSLLLSGAIYLLTPAISSYSHPDSPLLIFGIHDQYFASIDYFPLFPWMSIPALGIFLGSLLFVNGERKISSLEGISNLKIFSPLSWIGRKSLLIYMIHAPLIIAGLYIWNFFFGNLS